MAGQIQKRQPRKSSDQLRGIDNWATQPDRADQIKQQRLQSFKSPDTTNSLSSIDKELSRNENDGSYLPESIKNQNAMGSADDHNLFNPQKASATPANKLLDTANQEAAGVNKPISYNNKDQDQKQDPRTTTRRRRRNLGLGVGGGIVGLILGISLTNAEAANVNGLLHKITEPLKHMVEKRGIKRLVRNIASKKVSKGLADSLEKNYGITLEHPNDGPLTIKREGKEIGKFKTEDDLAKFLNGKSDDAVKLLEAIDDEITNKLGLWRWVIRIEAAPVLRDMFHITKEGGPDQNPDESDKDYAQRVVETEATEVGENTAELTGEVLECLSGDKSCDRLGKLDEQQLKEIQDGKINISGGVQLLEDKLRSAIEELVKKGAEAGATDTITKALLEKLLGAAIVTKVITTKAADLTPILGEVDTVDRIAYGVLNGAEKDVLTTAHSAIIASESGEVFAQKLYQTERLETGGYPALVAGRLSEPFTGAENAASYDFIAHGTANGEVLPAIQRIDETSSTPEGFKNFLSIVKNYASPISLWRLTIGKAMDAAGGLVNGLLEKIPAAQTALEKMSGVIGSLMSSLFDLLGLNFSPFISGVLLHLVMSQGGLFAFNSNSELLGGRRLTQTEAQAMDLAINTENATELANESSWDRLFNPNNPRSLVATVTGRLSVPSSGNALSDVATMGTNLVATAPNAVADITGSRTTAANNLIFENLFNMYRVGATEAELDMPLSADATTDCSKASIDGSKFDPCNLDKTVDIALNCKLGDCPQLGSVEDDTALDSPYDFSFAQVAWAIPTPDQANMFSNLAQVSGTVAAAIPLAALEISRRRV